MIVLNHKITQVLRAARGRAEPISFEAVPRSRAEYFNAVAVVGLINYCRKYLVRFTRPNPSYVLDYPVLILEINCSAQGDFLELLKANA